MTKQDILTKLNTPGQFSTPEQVTEFFEEALEQYAREKQLEARENLLDLLDDVDENAWYNVAFDENAEPRAVIIQRAYKALKDEMKEMREQIRAEIEALTKGEDK